MTTTNAPRLQRNSRAKTEKILADRFIRQGWNDARLERAHRDVADPRKDRQLRYECGRFMYVIAKGRAMPDTFLAPATTGKGWMEAMGQDVLKALYLDALKNIFN